MIMPVIVDDLDPKKDEYVKNFDDVVIFDKKEIAKTFDKYDTFEKFGAIVYARNACFQVARSLGIRYFIQLDDDYTDFRFRFDNKLDYVGFKLIKNLDRVFQELLTFYVNTPIASIAFSQGGDFIGGEGNQNAQKVKLSRKCMNSFICSTDRPFQFEGTINEDVNTYVRQGSIGKIFFTSTQIGLQQKQTQTNAGGMTELYLESGTYLKSFYTVIANPSSVTIKMMSTKFKRLHHSIKWNNAVPKILSQEVKKYG
jgi:hypothetical protein